MTIRKEAVDTKKAAKRKDTNLYIKGYIKDGQLVDALIYTANTIPKEDDKIYYTTNLIIPEETQKVVHFTVKPGTPITIIYHMAVSTTKQ
jgi:hypothetical protein